MNEKELLVKETFNKLKSSYDQSWDPKNHTLHVGLFENNKTNLKESFKNTNNYLMELIKRYSPLSKKSKIIDVCTGTGRTLLELTDRYDCKGVGIDISEEQISDAKLHNNKKCKFTVGSASNLTNFVKENNFTHAISQDGIFLVYNKEKCIREINNSLKSGGTFVFSDFLSEVPKEKIDAQKKAGVYETVKWEKGISFSDYKKLLHNTGFEILHSEKRGNDMIRTYELLIPQTKVLLKDDAKMCDKLVSRYQSIIDSVKNVELDWGWFTARKIT